MRQGGKKFTTQRLTTMLLLLAMDSVSSAEAQVYKGPARPYIHGPADLKPRRTPKLSECVADTKGVTAWDDAATLAEAKRLCKLEADAKAAHDRLVNGLAKLIETYRDYTNHDHAQRLPLSIKHIRETVANCLNALDSQHSCHNIGCLEEPVRDELLCDTKAAEIVEAMINPQ